MQQSLLKGIHFCKVIKAQFFQLGSFAFCSHDFSSSDTLHEIWWQQKERINACLLLGTNDWLRQVDKNSIKLFSLSMDSNKHSSKSSMSLDQATLTYFHLSQHYNITVAIYFQIFFHALASLFLFAFCLRHFLPWPRVMSVSPWSEKVKTQLFSITQAVVVSRIDKFYCCLP